MDETIWTSIDTMLSGQLAESSLRVYKRDIVQYCKFAELQKRDSTDAQTLLVWRNHLSLNTTLSPHTINRMIIAVKRVILEGSRNHLVSREINLDFSNIDTVKVKSLKSRLKKNSRTRITPEDMRRLVDAPNPDTIMGKRDRAMLLTLATSGLRAAECATLTQAHIKQVGASFFVQACGKSDIDLRDAHLSTEAHTAILEWLAARAARFPELDTTFIFTSLEGERRAHRNLSETTVWKTVKHYTKQLNIPDVKPHDLRRFVGTQLAAKDIRTAQLALGHKSIENTAKHYILDHLVGGETESLF